MSVSVNIQKKLRSFELDMEFQVNKRILGVLGASGSGKSMTLKMIAGIEIPDSGEILVNDAALFDSTHKINRAIQKRNIGYLFQNYALFPHMTVAQNIECALYHRDVNKAEMTEKLLNRFGLSGFEKRYPMQLSGGEQQRVAFARILAYNPDVLLLDEPFSALDGHMKEKIQIDMIDWLDEYSGDIIMVTHSRDEVFRICQDVMIMNQGKIAEMGTVQDVFDHPKTLAGAQLTGCKNVSRAHFISSNQVFAEDWNVCLQIVDDAPQNITHIGIRAHDFVPINDLNTINAFPIKIQKHVETLFEWDVLFQFADSNENSPLWWKYSKKDFEYLDTDYLCVNPDNILLLHE